MIFKALIEDLELNLTVEKTSDGFAVQVDDTNHMIDCRRLSPFSYSLIINNKSHYLSLTEKDGGYRITLDQQSYCVQLQDETEILLEKFGLNSTAEGSSQNIISPIPGLVKQIFVRPGDPVQPNDKLLILEAMKMENEILSTRSGRVGEIFAEIGMSKNKGDILLRIEGE